MAYLFIATLSFGCTLIFIKLAAVKMSPIAANLLYTGVAALIQVAVFLYYRSKDIGFAVTPSGLVFSLAGGVFLGIYTVTLFLSTSELPISKVSPVVYAGGIVLASVIGMILLSEPIAWQKFVGLALLTIGLFLVFG